MRDHGAAQSDRQLAIELAGDMTVVDNEICGLLIAILIDQTEPELLRSRAAISLGPVLEQTDTSGFDDPFDDPPITPEMFEHIKQTLEAVYRDEATPKLVRRRALEASVRAMQDWHADALRAQYASSDREWKLTAVFGMRYVPGLEKEVLEALNNPDEEIHNEAVQAAGEREIAEAWPHIAALLKSSKTPKPLLLAAIEASAWINPVDAGPALVDLVDSDDEEIAEAANDAMMEAESAKTGKNPYEEDEDDEDEEDEHEEYIN
jgi:HEAT repeats